MIFEAARNSEALDTRAHLAIQEYVARHGMQLRSIERRVWDWRLFIQRGLSNLARAYRVTALAPQGDAHIYTFAYEPAGWTGFERNGLKRWANGVWFDAD